VLLPVLPLLTEKGRASVTRALARAVLRAIGVRASVRGRLPLRHALLVANHVSWLDIVALLAHVPARIVAKCEVRGWPSIGALATATGTIFLDRNRPKSLRGTVVQATAVLRGGGVVAVFPEGTTWCGRNSGRFRPALFQAAIDACAPVAPVSLRFQLTDGTGTAAAAFLGDETLWTSVWRVLAVRGLTVVLVAAPALYPDPAADRRVLARAAQRSLSHV
jgi:1-acyl-sn-glycerol-3-phosphate acyltransferase